MSTRSDRAAAAVEVLEQRAKTNTARDALRAQLRDLVDAAGAAHRVLGDRPTADLSDLYGAVNAVRRGEEALDVALADLATASGRNP